MCLFSRGRLCCEMKSVLVFGLLGVFLIPVCSFAQAGKITHHELDFQGQKRSYELFLPDVNKTPSPLLLLMHPTGESDRSLVEAWKSLASKEGLALAGPSSFRAESWSMKEDPPAYIEAVMKDVGARHPIDQRRIYVFGFSAGAHYTIKLCLAHPDPFAACASAMGALEPMYFPALKNPVRRVPLILFAGSEDEYVPESAVIATRDALRMANYEVELHSFSDQGHNYYRRADEINRMAWKFFAAHTLSGQ